MADPTHLALVPRDGLFCKDGRGWSSSASGRGRGLDWPWPSTVLGALRTAWGRAEESGGRERLEGETWRTATSGVTLGPSLVLRRPLGATWSREHIVWPAPSDALMAESTVSVNRLEPVCSRVSTLGRDDDGTREALWFPKASEQGKLSPMPEWWSDTCFVTWLAGDVLTAPQLRNGRAFFGTSARRRVQVHVGISGDTLVARPGVLFSHDVVETLEADAEWAIGLRGCLPSGGLGEVATLGSDARIMRVEPLPENLFAVPPELARSFVDGSGGFRLILTTPACFAAGWLPDGLERRDSEFRGRLENLDREVVLRSAIVPRPWDVSGWDMAARAPKPTARMVPPGSVFFFEAADGRPFERDELVALWLTAVGGRVNEGFGRVVAGVWNPRRGEP